MRNIFNAAAKQSPDSAGSSLALPSGALRQLDHLQLNAGRFLVGSREGLRPSLRRRPSADFLEHRSYAPGDDVRFVDWKASARQEHIYIKQGDQPKEATVSLFIDCSASMAWGSPPKSAAELLLAMALSYLALAHGDRLVLVPYGKNAARPLGPLSGKGQVPGVLTYLRALQFGGDASLGGAALRFLHEQALTSGLVLILSDFLAEDGLEGVLNAFPAPLWQVALLQLLHPDELAPRSLGSVEVQDVETGQSANYDITPKAAREYQHNLSALQAALDLLCVRHYAQFTTLPTSWSLEKEVLSHLQRINLVKSL